VPEGAPELVSNSLGSLHGGTLTIDLEAHVSRGYDHRTMNARLWDLRQRILARIPSRHLAALRSLIERLFNAGPDAPFLAVRRRYAARMREINSAAPPALLRLAAFRRHVPAAVETFEVIGRPDLSLVNVESVGTRVIFWTGHRWVTQHGAGLEIWERLSERADDIVELGANVGFYTIAGGKAARGRYTAVEPHPNSCATLQRNLKLNGLAEVEVLEAAVVPSPAPPTVELICTTGTDRDAPSGAMVKGSSFEGHESLRETTTVVVPAVPIGDAVAGRDLVKIDVEGLEAKLLEDAWDHLLAAKPAIMIEIHDFNADLRTLLPRLMAEVDATAYAMHHDHLTPVALDLLQQGQLMQTCGTWDFLIVPAERSAVIAGLVRA
jgi:FkbM family methyltransferase